MKLPTFKFIQPQSIEEICQILHENYGITALLAGGTSLIVSLRYRLKTPNIVIGMKGLSSLTYISHNEEGITIGPMMTLEALEKSPIILKEFPSLVSTIKQIALPPIRNQATIGGNICLDTRCIYYNQSKFWRSSKQPCFKLGGEICHAVEKGKSCQAVYSGDLAPILIALEARLKIISLQGKKDIPVAQFFTGQGEKPNILNPNELISEIFIPKPNKELTFCFKKIRIREGMDFPLASVAVRLVRREDGTISDMKIVLGAVGTSPIELKEFSSIIEGQKVTDELIDHVSKIAMEGAIPIGNLAIHPGYRRKMIKVLVRRTLKSIIKMDY